LTLAESTKGESLKAHQMVRELIGAGLNAGDARTAGPLTLVPLFGGAPGGNYLVAEEGFASGKLTITELHGGQVQELEAINAASLPVLLLDGEHLQGAKQDRVLVASALLAAGSRTVLPVACVEHGRWHYEHDMDFVAGEDFAYSRLRRRTAAVRNIQLAGGLTRSADQSAVWDDVAHKMGEVGVAPSSTGDMGHAFRGSRARLEEIVRPLKGLEPGQTGAIACIGGVPVAMDCFDRPGTLERLWNRLLGGYAMEALSAVETPLEPRAIGSFLSEGAAAQATVASGLGLGRDVALTGSTVVGNALVWDESVVHVALFGEGAGGQGAGGRIEGPSSRRRLHLH
jgi:hypothetical protein